MRRVRVVANNKMITMVMTMMMMMMMVLVLTTKLRRCSETRTVAQKAVTN